MEAFTVVTGVAAPLMRNNVDTDQITPGRTGMKVQKTGFASGLFANWRYHHDGSEDPAFVLNQEPFRRARFLVAGSNFGCGSSREFAVWALRDFGIRAVIAPSFGAIFASNCHVNGLLPIALEESAVGEIAAGITPQCTTITVDLDQQHVVDTNGKVHRFEFAALQRERFLEGIDAIDATLKRKGEIDAYQFNDARKRPWVYSIGTPA